ncbi:MAG: D-Ala-D-Ala carboxypeptidase family metallohydrolase [Gemmatimonas sp.]|uniref:D-Ala-D-Ala carboxypeptidase family metallohydrolase n=1 Tax=Gemmatimonas sp. TaxID=1962908 RepID=UPI003919F082
MIQRRTALVLSGLIAITAAVLYQPPGELFADSSAESFRRAVPRVEVGAAARGVSGEIKMHFVRAGERVALPLEIRGASGSLGFEDQWVAVGSGESGDVVRPLEGDTLLAPLTPGIYELEVTRHGVTQRLEEPRLAVMVPFELKLGSTLNGYQIGRYPAEWSRDEAAEKPLGFAEVHEEHLDLPLTKHLRVRDFVTHDRQTMWPKYVAVDPRVLDKIELVLRELARRRGEESASFMLEVHSGFRTPLHNAGVEGSARDSRHLYGDAADVAIDADGDGELTLFDAYRVEQAVDWVERAHPELAGGLGVYSSRRYATPYCHIDARGERKRWRG